MTERHRFTFAGAGPSAIEVAAGTALGQASASAAAGQTTSDVIRRFNDAFQRHDSTLLPELIADDCIIENTTPAPNGARNVMRVRNGLIVEALGYSKGA